MVEGQPSQESQEFPPFFKCVFLKPETNWWFVLFCLVETPEILVQQCWMVRKIIQVIPIGKFVLMLQKAANWSLGKYESELIPFAIWVVVSDILLFSTLSPGK